MGGTMRSPLTAIVFALELTHNIGALVPVAVACVMAHATTVLLLRRSILTEKVARRGHHVMREYIVDPFETMRVSEIMAKPVETLPADMPIGDVVKFFTAGDTATRPQELSGGRCRRPARRHRLALGRAALDGRGLADRSGRCATWSSEQELTVGYDDELVGRLADRMAAADASRVPILRRGDRRRGRAGRTARPAAGAAAGQRHETEREVLIPLRGGRTGRRRRVGRSKRLVRAAPDSG